jgi:hypothetical protein
MKLLLDCDDVFDRLTRGPFPSGAPDDEAVEAHLCTCHECRQLAEALRPAVKLMHEAYADTSDEPLPVYTGSAVPSLRRSAAPKEWSVGWQLVAASLIGVVIGSLAAGDWFSAGNPPAQVGWSSAEDAAPSASGLATLAALKLREVCLPSSMALASGSVGRLRCCTDCHSSQAAAPKGIDVSRLQLACVACHER